ncbi:periplasmic heavy metal sensor [Herbaspirillum sp. ST 5-3]|uniref:periplasmic heavy metal sensor n=1 Tax=Oxalobacteraceae TaxID=75682 RepID=UPI0010A469AC|nr:periplasmic heavy metal sensor [Herbaspirillum sp. ST 5-3]
MKTLIFTLALAISSIPACAQHMHPQAAPDAPSPAMQHAHSPYAGMQGRSIKALSEQQLNDLRAGKGMALALPAELNGYPGPAHVLELAAPLGLSDAQKRKTQALFDQMQSETKTLGAALIAAEHELDRLFSERKVSAESLEQATANAAQAQGRLRAAHLRYHVSMLDVLNPEQVNMYMHLRGYN